MELEDPVLVWEMNESSYIMRSEGGLRLDVTKCYSYQPEIEAGAESYSAFMWLRSLQGCYVLRQDFVEGEAGPWVVVREVVPENPGPYFFEEFHDTFPEYVAERFLR